MAGIGGGYGSECNLLRWMGRHRGAFDRAILEKVKGGYSSISWLDFKFDAGKKWADAELKGLEFLKDNQVLQSEWKKFWPARGGGVPNWDAAGWLIGMGGEKRLVLVEAKAHVEEIESDCKAVSVRSRARIDAAFEEVKDGLGIACENDWKKGYYQFANRLATLYFLERHGVAAHLVFIYFMGDKFPKKYKFICPESEDIWASALDEQYNYLGLGNGHKMQNQISNLFLRVDG